MEFLIALVASAVLAYVCRDAFAKVPFAMYAVAVVLVVGFALAMRMNLPVGVRAPLTALVQKGTLGFAMLMVVMFIGVLPSGSVARRRLEPIRGELAIFAWILMFGHLYLYVTPRLFARLFSGNTSSAFMSAGFAVGAIAFVLLIVLSVTSFRLLRKHMKPSVWSAVQKSSYVFVALAAAHIALMLGPSAAAGSVDATVRLVCYAVVLVTYAVLRWNRGRGNVPQQRGVQAPVS